MISKSSTPGLGIPASHWLRLHRLPGLALAIAASVVQTVCAASPAPEAPGHVRAPAADFIVVPSATNAVQFRLYLNGSPDASHLFNTFEVQAYGETLLRSPDALSLKRSLLAPASTAPINNILVDGEGPHLDPSNSMSVVERASGAEWFFVSVDATAAYRGRLKDYRRGILFVEPDLFVLHDHLVAERPSSFQMVLHPPAATQLDPVWGDLRLDSTNAGVRIHAPGQRHDPRFWRRMESSSDAILPGTTAMLLGPTNKLATLDLLTVFAVHKGGEKKENAFKFLQSYTAVGARIHREGLPTLVAFRIDPAELKPSLTGFAFGGPVGVDIFKPKRIPGAK
jgi:hypothetical protein